MQRGGHLEEMEKRNHILCADKVYSVHQNLCWKEIHLDYRLMVPFHILTTWHMVNRRLPTNQTLSRITVYVIAHNLLDYKVYQTLKTFAFGRFITKFLLEDLMELSPLLGFSSHSGCLP